MVWVLYFGWGYTRCMPLGALNIEPFIKCWGVSKKMYTNFNCLTRSGVKLEHTSTYGVCTPSNLKKSIQKSKSSSFLYWYDSKHIKIILSFKFWKPQICQNSNKGKTLNSKTQPFLTDNQLIIAQSLSTVTLINLSLSKKVISVVLIIHLSSIA